jgi:hypothetical protein
MLLITMPCRPMSLIRTWVYHYDLCHSLKFGFVTTTYVTKESYVINQYAMKAYVIHWDSNLSLQPMSLRFVSI